VLTVHPSLTVTAMLFLLSTVGVCQTSSHDANRSILKHPQHKVSCLCGTVEICSGDICGRPQTYELDDDIAVELEDKAGAILDSKKVTAETIEKECTRQDGTKVSCKTTERRFCFEGKPDGDYLLTFILYKNGTAQPAAKFPTSYSRKRHKPCDSVYMVEPR
jgi:hypothetical protein